MHWTVTIDGLSDVAASRRYETARAAIDAYEACVDQLQDEGFQREGEEAVAYGRRWSRRLVRGGEAVTVRLETHP